MAGVLDGNCLGKSKWNRQLLHDYEERYSLKTDSKYAIINKHGHTKDTSGVYPVVRR